ncbi:transcription termination/antitermination NusG family protein [Endozoicomonas arenosclerae]|uniref:transcription termination/antitermination NusG family protein n=1 Tax=Endozoicomonas arenosclerae TaxID=1633495 RepID=UPI000783AB20|nr:transcription termination/antitermination NusG family protein [Endozoicomonas arenosclerae]
MAKYHTNKGLRPLISVLLRTRFKKGSKLEVIRRFPNQEQRAEQNLFEQNIAVYCPYIIGELNKQPLFQGYLFVCLPSDIHIHFHQIKYTRGVVDFIRFDHCSKALPKPIPDGSKVISDVRNIESAINSKHQKTDAHFHKGDIIKVNNPLFEHLHAEFIKYSGADRGLLLVQYIREIRQHSQLSDQVLGERLINVPLNQIRKL